MLEIVVFEIRGSCPVYKVGDKIVFDDPRIVLEWTDALCVHALSSLLHYVLVLDRAWNAVELGLTKPEDSENAYIQCVDPGKPYTHGGTVIFKIRKISEDKRLG
ncbi:MAG: TIGR04076 family protein [Candidatus Bathyarchaeia archaeon]